MVIYSNASIRVIASGPVDLPKIGSGVWTVSLEETSSNRVALVIAFDDEQDAKIAADGLAIAFAQAKAIVIPDFPI